MGNGCGWVGWFGGHRYTRHARAARRAPPSTNPTHRTTPLHTPSPPSKPTHLPFAGDDPIETLEPQRPEPAGSVARRPEVDLYPEALRAEIDAANAWVYDDVNNGVYK